MYKVSEQNYLPYEVNIMRGCVSFHIKVQILAFYTDVCMGHTRSFTRPYKYPDSGQIPARFRHLSRHSLNLEIPLLPTAMKSGQKSW